MNKNPFPKRKADASPPSNPYKNSLVPPMSIKSPPPPAPKKPAPKPDTETKK